MPVREHVPLYFAYIVLIMMQPLQCDAVCQRFADLAAGLQIIDKIDERTARIYHIHAAGARIIANFAAR